MSEYNNSYCDLRTITDVTHKYINFCNSLTNFTQNDSNTICKTIFDAINLRMACDQMPAQQGQTFTIAGVMVLLSRLSGTKL